MRIEPSMKNWKNLAPDDSHNYTDFFQRVKKAAGATSTKLKKKPQDWFEYCKHQVLPVIDRKNNLLNEYRKAFGTEADLLYSQVKLATTLRDIAVKAGKSAFLSHQADKIGSLTDGGNKRK